MNYEKVTAVEYLEKRTKMLNSLGRLKDKCTGVRCEKCPLSAMNNPWRINCGGLECEHPIKAVEIVMNYKMSTDWSKVDVDTPILVKGNRSCQAKWHRRYFAKYEDGVVYAFPDGATSWSVNSETRFIPWDDAKLYESEEKDAKE